ncbi:MAG: hypothetical protein ACFFAS_20430 [Promethearchaeota archaeon]
MDKNKILNHIHRRIKDADLLLKGASKEATANYWEGRKNAFVEIFNLIEKEVEG